MSALLLKPGDRIVFFGDSITQADPGYVSFIKEMLDSLYPELKVDIINAGIGGNSVRDLLERMDTDVVAGKPNWVSVSIGINDAWPGHSNSVSPEDFDVLYDELIGKLAAQTGARIACCTPSIISEDPESDTNVKLKSYAVSVMKAAEKHEALLVPIHDAFINALKRAKGATDKALFTTDGVHLNNAGNTMFGTTWLKALGAFADLLP